MRRESQNNTSPTAVRGVAVCADDEGARERVVLQNNLMNDAAARLPEANAVLGRRRRKEVIHLDEVERESENEDEDEEEDDDDDNYYYNNFINIIIMGVETEERK